jgi:hypothetical protein
MCWRWAGGPNRVDLGRIAYQMVAGGQVFRHPCLQHRSYILDKLNAFEREHA